PSEGEVERVPEELDGARLAVVAAGELLEDAGCEADDGPEALDRLAVVGRMPPVARERRLRREVVRHGADARADAEVGYVREEPVVELRDREPVVQRDAGNGPVARADVEPVHAEVELDV